MPAFQDILTAVQTSQAGTRTFRNIFDNITPTDLEQYYTDMWDFDDDPINADWLAEPHINAAAQMADYIIPALPTE